ncbi:MAG: YitT family protein [Clostridia bacterium]|nr:YitT family protein [Clostridia bacterium]
MEKNKMIETRVKLGRILTDYICLSIGTILVTVGLYIFAIPNQFVMGGVTGISIVIAPFLPSWLTPATFVLVLNVLLLLVGFAFLGKDFGFKTVYTSMLLSIVGMVIEYFGTAGLPEGMSRYPLTDNLVLELVLSVVLPAIGSAIVFYYNGSGGGTDIIAMILKKYSRIPSGKALLCVDSFIMLVSFTYGIEIGLLSALGLFAKSLIVDRVNLSMNRSKYVIIITTYPEEVGEYINKVIGRGATMWQGVGVYTHEKKYILLAVMNQRQAAIVRDEIKKIDEHAFLVLDETSDIVGNGFRALI